MKSLKRLSASALMVTLLVIGFSVATPRTAQAASDTELVSLLASLVEKLNQQLSLLQQKESESSGGREVQAGAGSGSMTATTSQTSASTTARVSSESSSNDTSCEGGKNIKKFPTNKKLFRAKILKGDVAGLLSGEVLVRVYETETIVRAEMQKKVDMFKTQAKTKEAIKEEVLKRYGFTKSIQKLMGSLGAGPLADAISIKDCESETEASLF